MTGAGIETGLWRRNMGPEDPVQGLVEWNGRDLAAMPQGFGQNRAEGAAPSPSGSMPLAEPPGRWADGGAEVVYAVRAGRSRLCRLEQRFPCRVLFPQAPERAPPEAVIATVSGGIVAGDRVRLGLGAGTGAAVSYTTQAAEKIYRSTGAVSEIDVTVEVADGACLEWMPQETILFEGARLRRRTRLHLSSSARLIAGEMICFGRRARGETFARGFLHDGWRVHIDSRLVWVDALHVEAGLAPALRSAYTFGDAAAVAVLVCHGADPAALRKRAQDCLGDAAGSGVTRVDDLVIARFIDADAARLRDRYAGLWQALRREITGFDGPLPRVWET